MGTILMGAIVDRARVTLLERDGELGTPNPTDTRWNRLGETLEHGNASMIEIVAALPQAGVRNVPYQLQAGATQGVPDGCIQFFGVEHNLGADGNTPGRAIIQTDRKALTKSKPNWMTSTGASVENFVIDQRSMKRWYAYPRPPGTWYVDMLGVFEPGRIDADDIDDPTDGRIPIDDIYAPAMHDYIVGYSLLKTFRAGDVNRASYFLTKFYNFLGKKFDMANIVATLDADAQEEVPDALGKA